MKCPKCNREIDYLANMVSGVMEYILRADNNPVKSVQRSTFVSDSGINEFWCPECDELLFTDEESAIEFLKGV